MKRRELDALLDGLGLDPDAEVVLQDGQRTYEAFEIVRAEHEYPEGDPTDEPEAAEDPDELVALDRPIIVIRVGLMSKPRAPTTA